MYVIICWGNAEDVLFPRTAPLPFAAAAAAAAFFFL